MLKSRLVLAVVRAVVHPDGAAAAELDAVADESAAHGMLPLTWPARLAAADLLDRLVSPIVSERLPSANEWTSPSAHESVNGRTNGTARRRHAAAATVSALYQLSDPAGRRLMGESVWLPARPPVT